jgi:hypothetical protein
VRHPLCTSPSGHARGPVADRCIWPAWTGYANGGQDDATRGELSCGYRTTHRALVAAGQIQLRFTNTGNTPSGEEDGPGQITVKAAVLYGGTLYPVTFGGAPTKTLAAGAQADSDTIAGLAFAAAASFQVLTYVQAPTPGQWPANLDIRSLANGDGYQVGSDVTVTGTVNGLSHDGWAYGPSAITGVAASRSSVRGVAIFGDSIASTVDGYGDRAFAALALNTLSVPYVRCATSGDGFGGFAQTGQHERRLALAADLCSEAVCQYGANDMRGEENNPLSYVQANAITSWQLMRDAGIRRVYQTTCTPFSEGTVDAQTTLSPNNDVRVAWNGWLRAGAPIDASTHAAVAIGTTGALTAGTGDHPLAAVIELADAVETGRNSGLWVPAYFDDGVHPHVPDGVQALADALAATSQMTALLTDPTPTRLAATVAGVTVSITTAN